jgi:hypothetical protein
LLATAARLREWGKRLPSPPLSGAIDAVRDSVGGVSPLDLDDAVRLARNLPSKVGVPA